mmetsp:Transcript_2801/g.3894  ORF Transcript_2801/g.3894 Transcript_2801/m.3894 type:complete len:237 (-) Transcript_2801:79-789(-)
MVTSTWELVRNILGSLRVIRTVSSCEANKVCSWSSLASRLPGCCLFSLLPCRLSPLPSSAWTGLGALRARGGLSLPRRTRSRSGARSALVSALADPSTASSSSLPSALLSEEEASCLGPVSSAEVPTAPAATPWASFSFCSAAAEVVSESRDRSRSSSAAPPVASLAPPSSSCLLSAAKANTDEEVAAVASEALQAASRSVNRLSSCTICCGVSRLCRVRRGAAMRASPASCTRGE